MVLTQKSQFLQKLEASPHGERVSRLLQGPAWGGSQSLPASLGPKRAHGCCAPRLPGRPGCPGAVYLVPRLAPPLGRAAAAPPSAQLARPDGARTLNSQTQPQGLWKDQEATV